MAHLLIESTAKTPHINFNGQTGLFEIRGMSCSEYAFNFYKPVFDWLDNYVKNPNEKTTVNVQLKYFNTSSAKCILQMFERIGALQDQKRFIEVNWYYERDDEQMIADGENYSVLLGLPFKLKELGSS